MRKRAVAALLILGSMLLPARADTNFMQLDNSTVTTGGTAVVALVAGKRTGGGFLFNPTTATAPLCINETGTATTAGQGATTCIGVGVTYRLSPSVLPVSVNATDSAHIFSGYGIQ